MHLSGVQVETLRLSGRRSQWRLGQCQRGMDRRGNLDAIAMTSDVHVHHMWRFVKQVVVNRRDFDASID